MAAFTQFIQAKKNRKWLWIGGAVIGFIVLVVLLRGGSRSSGGGSTAGASGPSEALQAAQLDAQVQMAGIQAGVNAAALQSQAQVEIAKLASASELAGINANLQALSIQAQGADRDSERAFQATIAGLNQQQAIATEQLRTQQMITEAQLAADTQQLAVSVAGSVAQQEIYTNALVNLQTAQIYAQRDTELAQTYSARDVQLAGIDAQLQSTLGQQQLQQYALTKAKRKHIPAILAGDSPQLGTKTNAILGGVLSLGGLLSDIRAKRQVRQIGERSDGVPLYSFEYAGGGGMQAGVIAQELALMAPEYVLDTGRGMLGVDYYALDAAA